MIVLDDGGGLRDLLWRVLGWGPPPPPSDGPPPENTADHERVRRSTREVTDRALRAERLVREFTERQRQEIEALRERVRYYERRGGG